MSHCCLKPVRFLFWVFLHQAMIQAYRLFPLGGFAIWELFSSKKESGSYGKRWYCKWGPSLSFAFHWWKVLICSQLRSKSEWEIESSFYAQKGCISMLCPKGRREIKVEARKLSGSQHDTDSYTPLRYWIVSKK